MKFYGKLLVTISCMVEKKTTSLQLEKNRSFKGFFRLKDHFLFKIAFFKTVSSNLWKLDSKGMFYLFYLISIHR